MSTLAVALVAAAIALKDDVERTVELKRPAQRIVTLAPFLTELVFAAGAGERVVGVSAYSDYPPEAGRLPQVSTAAGFSIERIAALQPDLVLVWRDSVRPEDIERITRFGAAVFVVHARNFEDVPRALKAIGALTERPVERLIAGYDGKLAALRRQYGSRRRLEAFLEIWHKPLTTVAGRHFMNEALEICGAHNVFRDLEGISPVVQWEEVYRRDPEIVVGAGSATNAAEFRANWKARDTLSAARREKLVFVDADRIRRLTTRTPDGVADLCAAIERVRSF